MWRESNEGVEPDSACFNTLAGIAQDPGTGDTLPIEVVQSFRRMTKFFGNIGRGRPLPCRKSKKSLRLRLFFLPDNWIALVRWLNAFHHKTEGSSNYNLSPLVPILLLLLNTVTKTFPQKDDWVLSTKTTEAHLPGVVLNRLQTLQLCEQCEWPSIFTDRVVNGPARVEPDGELKTALLMGVPVEFSNKIRGLEFGVVYTWPEGEK